MIKGTIDINPDGSYTATGLSGDILRATLVTQQLWDETVPPDDWADTAAAWKTYALPKKVKQLQSLADQATAIATAIAGRTQMGSVTLSFGFYTVSGVRLESSSIITISRNTPGGGIGDLHVADADITLSTTNADGSVNSDGQFRISSASGTDSSTVNWSINA